jgi:hypothetical protein
MGTSPDDVFDDRGQSIKDRYLLDACYAVELLSGEETKVAEACLKWEHIRRIVEVFQARGIETSDASVFKGHHPALFKLIDIELVRD